MSISHAINEIEYPESDGQPMGETDLHRDWMNRILDILRYRYRGQRVYVGSNLLVYYQQGRPTKYVVPDNFVVLDCDPDRRRTFRTWQEGKSPDVVFEVTSRSTAKDDLVTKPPIYEKMGVAEYFLYDPSDAYLEQPLMGYRMLDGELIAISPRSGILHCQTLGIDLSLDNGDLVMTDCTTGQRLPTGEEAEKEARVAETAARKAAETRVRELEEQLRRRDQSQ